jgi:hypothetical protein
MSQTLTVLPAVTSPVTVAQAATLSANLAAINDLDNRMVIALSVISAIHELAGVGGFDYRTNHKQLRQDASTYMNVFNTMTYLEGQAAKLRAVLDWNDGKVADATTSSDVNTLVKEMAGMRETPEYTLEKFYYFLQIRLPQ